MPAGRDLADALVAKRGELVLVLPRDLGGAGAPFGLRLQDTLHLPAPRVLVDGRVPAVLAAADDPVVLVTDRGTVRWTLVSGREAVLELRVEGRGRAVVELDLAGWARTGADGVPRATRLDTAPPSAGCRWEVALPATLAVRVTCDPGTPEPPAPPAAPAAPVVEADDERFGELLHRALGDLALLRTPLAGAQHLAAGLPRHAALLGREALLGALMALAWDQDLAAGTLRLLATAQGREADGVPGRVLSELRLGEHASLSYEGPDPTPLLLVVLAEHARWTASHALLDDLRAAVDAALAWLETADLAEVEAQAWAVAAERALGDLLRDPGLRRRADRRVAALPVPAPPEGVLLLARAVGPIPAAEVAEALLSPGRCSGWGLRTPGGGDLRGPDAGGVPAGATPVDGLFTVSAEATAIAAAGLRRTGRDADFVALFDGLLDAAAASPGGRLPARMAGLPREPGVPPAPDPGADRPQATAAAALPFLLVEGLGLQPDGAGRLVIERPVLPRPVRRLRVRGLRVGDGVVDLAFERTAGGARLASARGDVEVLER